MIYFTSDLHLGHKNIIRFCDRPFSSIQEMDEQLIENWNMKVKKQDTVYILGDLMFRAKEPPEYYLGQMKGRKHLILGNHDKYWIKKVQIDRYFESVGDYLKFSDGQHQIIVCHYPMMSWPGGRKAYMVFGHIHNDTAMDFWPIIRNSENLLNAGVDVNDFFPVSLDEMIANNRRFKEMH